MGRRRGKDEDDETSGESAPRLSEGTLSSFLEAFAKAQAESNRLLIESLRSTPAASSASASPPPSHSFTEHKGNFSRGTARYSGTCRDSEVLEAFVDAIEIYKECTGISDEHALRGLPMLLEGEAAVWFRGVKASVTSWDDALKKLRAMFGVPRPPHKILRNIFATEQTVERTEVFVGRLRALIMKLPYVVAEEMAVDIVYGLLHKRILKRVTRETVNNFDTLIEKARNIEDSLSEVTHDARGPVTTASALARQSAPAPLPALPSINEKRAPTMSAVTQPASTSSSGAAVSHDKTDNKKGKLFCVYCRKSGHTRDQCLKIKNKNESNVSCYGCGAKNVIRANCTHCQTKE